MAQKYSKKTAARNAQRKGAKPGSSVPAFLAGLVVGILGTQFLPVLLEKKAAVSKEHSQKPTASSPEFQFPNMLRGTDIRISDNLAEGKSAFTSGIFTLDVPKSTSCESI